MTMTGIDAAHSSPYGVPRVYHYQGATGSLPPNTVEAFLEALRHEPAGLAIDVSLTSDDVLVACDDRLVRALTGEPKAVFELSSHALCRIDLGLAFGGDRRGVFVPRLADVVDRLGGRIPLIWLFTGGVPDERLLSGLAKLSSRSLGVDASARSLGGERGPGDIVLVSHSAAFLTQAGLFMAGASRVLHVSSLEDLRDVGDRGFDGFAAPCLAFPEAGRQTPKIRSKRLVIGTECNSFNAAQRAESAPCDIVLTERPVWLRQLYENRRVPLRPAGRTG